MPKKYEKAAAKKVGKVMHEFKRGTLKSSNGAKVKSREQAIAIGLSEARERGLKVPPPPDSPRKASYSGARPRESKKR